MLQCKQGSQMNKKHSANAKTPEPADPRQAVEIDEQHSSSPITESSKASVEIGGRNGPEPTRFGDWEKNGRCIDF